MACFLCGAEGRTRTGTGLPTTPSRWRVYQFPPLRHVGPYCAFSSPATGVVGCFSGVGTSADGSACVFFPASAGSIGVTPSLVAGAVTAGLTPFITESPVTLLDRLAKMSEVIMKTIATAAVSLPKKVLPPVEPNSVCEELPKTAPISDPLPVCSSTIMIRAIQMPRCNTTSAVCIKLKLSSMCYSGAEI